MLLTEAFIRFRFSINCSKSNVALDLVNLHMRPNGLTSLNAILVKFVKLFKAHVITSTFVKNARS